MQLLAEVLVKNSSIRCLNLSKNQFKTPGLQFLVNALQTNKTLQKLLLKDMDLSKDAQSLFSIDTLNANKTITCIELGTTQPVCVVQYLERNKSIIAENSTNLTQHILNNNWDEVQQAMEKQSKFQIDHMIAHEELTLDKLCELNKFACNTLDKKIAKLKEQIDNAAQQKNLASSKAHDLYQQKRILEEQLQTVQSNILRQEESQRSWHQKLTAATNLERQLRQTLYATKKTLAKHEEELATWKKIQDIKLSEWTKEDVVLLLQEIKLRKFSQLFLNSSINGSILIHLTSSEFIDFGMSFKEVKQLQKAIFQLQCFQNLTAAPDALGWTSDEVKKWLEDNGFKQIIPKVDELKITGGDLLFMDRHDLTQQLQITLLADKVKLEQAIKDLKEQILKKYMKVKVKKEDKNASVEEADDVDSIYKCPLTKAIMTEPVTADDGYTYERKAIEEWIDQHGTSPQTNEPLSRSALRNSLSMKKAIERFLHTKNM